MELVVATRNKDKLREIKTLLKGLPVDVFSLDSFRHAPEVIEDGKTLEENALKKAVQVSQFLKKFAVADDSGLEVEYLNGQPGVYSARFSGKGATYKSNNEKLLRLLKDLPLNKRKACFKCVIGIADKGRVIGVAEGRCRGRIAYNPMGNNGFGYDPVFIPYGFRKTFGQMSASQKNKISHRHKALVAAKKIISSYLASLVTCPKGLRPYGVSPLTSLMSRATLLPLEGVPAGGSPTRRLCQTLPLIRGSGSPPGCPITHSCHCEEARSADEAISKKGIASALRASQ